MSHILWSPQQSSIPHLHLFCLFHLKTKRTRQNSRKYVTELLMRLQNVWRKNSDNDTKIIIKHLLIFSSCFMFEGWTLEVESDYQIISSKWCPVNRASVLTSICEALSMSFQWCMEKERAVISPLRSLTMGLWMCGVVRLI